MKKRSAGFTLVEMLLYMGLLSILVFVLTDVFLSVVQTRLGSEAYTNVEQDGRYILNRLTYDITQSSSVTTPTTLGGTSSSLAIVVGGVTYTYSVNTNGQFQVTNNNGTDVLETSETTMLNQTFQRLGNSGGKDTILMTFTIASKTLKSNGQPESQTFQTTVERRN